MLEPHAHPRVDELQPLAPRELGIRRLVAAALGHLRWRTLDHSLADGTDPSSTPALAARARHLTMPETRGRLADSVRTVILAAGRPPAMPSSRIPPSRPEVPAARLELAAIESRLRSNARVSARGVARLELLLTDGGGPLYSPDYPAALSVELERIRIALGAEEEDWRDA